MLSKLICFWIFLVPFFVYGQNKATISHQILNAQPWPTVTDITVSNNGKYVFYGVRNIPDGNHHTMIIKSLDGVLEKEFLDVRTSETKFTDDSKLAIFKIGRDSLCLLSLGQNRQVYRSISGSFSLVKRGSNEWLIYQKNNGCKDLIFYNCTTGEEVSFCNVESYRVSDNGGKVVIVKRTESGNQSVNWTSIGEQTVNIVWEGNRAHNIILDRAGSQFAFIGDDDKGMGSIWYYKIGYKEAKVLINQFTLEVGPKIKIGSISRFSNDGCRLFIQLKELGDSVMYREKGGVDVWSYFDAKLQSEQLFDIKNGAGKIRSFDYLSVFLVSDNKMIRLQEENERLLLDPYSKSDENILIIKGSDGNGGEWKWNKSAQYELYIVSTTSGKRQKLPNNLGMLSFSPNGKWGIGFDKNLQDIYSYEVTTGIFHNLTKKLTTSLTKTENFSGGQWRGFETSGIWLKDGSAVLVYDQFDIWQLDPKGIRAPINLTNGYGTRNRICFRIPRNGPPQEVVRNQELIISAFNRVNKENGFFRLTIGKAKDPELLTMGPYVYNVIGARDFGGGMSPIKAKDASVYIIRKESASQSPNFYYTTDFHSFNLISDIFPEKDFNWLQAELITFKMPNGVLNQAVVYKPEDFDPQKEYPVIIHYYEKLTDRLNQYRIPELLSDNINIPYFVSQGYVVLAPDISYKIGRPGKSALDAILAARKKLLNYSWVDSTKIGLQGHSWGGYETNYIVTHSNLFSAAVSSSGWADMISHYNSVMVEGNGSGFLQSLYESGQSRIGATLWERPDLFVINSPIFNAHKVTTPILLMNNKLDAIIPFSQGVEFFLALRRLGKRAWMLQYDEEAHSIIKKEASKIDYTIRMTQFFDHYLKDAPAAKWMLEGIPARKKGIDDGLELVKEKDENGNWVTPFLGGLLTLEEQEKVNALRSREPIIITIN